MELLACSPHITIDGATFTLSTDASAESTSEFVYISRQSSDGDGCYSISFKHNGIGGYFGFGVNDATSRLTNSAKAWKLTAYQSSTGAAALGGSGITVSTNGMGRPLGTDTLTLMYNPNKGTLHGAYNLEPGILLRDNIPASPYSPMQPFFAAAKVGASVTFVANPRSY